MTQNNLSEQWQKRGVQFECAGQLAQARVAYSFAWENSPSDAKLCMRYARLLIEIRDLETATQVLDCLADDYEGKTNRHYLCLRGNIEKSRHNFEEAIDWYQQIKLPNETFPSIFIGSCFARQGKFDEAIDAYLRATELPYKEGVTQPDEAWVGIALIRRAKEDYEGAAKAAKRAIAFDNDYKAAREILEDVPGAIDLRGQDIEPGRSAKPCLFDLYRNDLFAQSLVVARQRVRQEPEWIQAQTRLGVLLIEFRRFAEAEKFITQLESPSYRKVLENSLDDEEIEDSGSAKDRIKNVVLELKAHLERQRGNLGLSTQLLKQLVKRMPNYICHAMDLEEVLTLQQRYDEALEVCEQVREHTRTQRFRGSSEETAIMDAGKIHRIRQSYRKAAEAWRDGDVRFPENTQFRKLAEDAEAAGDLRRMRNVD